MLNRMLKEQRKLNNSEAGVVHGKGATVWGALTMERVTERESLPSTLVQNSFHRAAQSKHVLLINLGPV